MQWRETFLGKDLAVRETPEFLGIADDYLQLIGSTRLFRVKNLRAQALMKISEDKLQVVSQAVDKLIQWALNTLTRLRKTSSTLLMWLKSCRSDDPNRRPFRCPQEPTTVKRYGNHWKQFLFYTLRTSLLDESTRDHLYGIR